MTDVEPILGAAGFDWEGTAARIVERARAFAERLGHVLPSFKEPMSNGERAAILEAILRRSQEFHERCELLGPNPSASDIQGAVDVLFGACPTPATATA